MNNQEKETKREKFKIEIEQCAEFPSIAKTAYISSNDFCKTVSDLFKSVFADFEGCIFEVPNSNNVPNNMMEPTISLLFNHGKYGEDDICACELAGAKASGNSVIDRTRHRDRQLLEGDRYYLTEDGKDALTVLLTSKAFNNGNPDWRRNVSEYQDRNISNMYNYGPVTQYTKVSNISLQRLCGLIFGDKDEDGNRIEYTVNIASTFTPVGFQYSGITANYILTVTSVSAKEVTKIYEKLGFGGLGVNIVR